MIALKLKDLKKESRPRRIHHRFLLEFDSWGFNVSVVCGLFNICECSTILFVCVPWFFRPYFTLRPTFVDMLQNVFITHWALDGCMLVHSLVASEVFTAREEKDERENINKCCWECEHLENTTWATWCWMAAGGNWIPTSTDKTGLTLVGTPVSTDTKHSVEREIVDYSPYTTVLSEPRHWLIDTRIITMILLLLLLPQCGNCQ